ncbi:hypothetical protein NMK71_05655 [Weeksellaceae bacterium KMM 9713]|uniref:Uncharacterized protein n=1 Tax=Profundicola chukchiensis TaxID=2961959 RepID=A0A9X4MYH4_9FLAO|nr:hypothetical protein [Profundicola chukchiensis]MDG4945892.1 hypothetical protein [Profundicola chukchiensis]
MKPSLPHNKFKTPENYFEDLENKILAETIEANSTKVIPIYQKNWFKVAVSTAAAVLLIVGFWFMSQSPNVSAEDQIYAQETVYEVYFEDDLDETYILEEEPVLVEFVGLSNP